MARIHSRNNFVFLLVGLLFMFFLPPMLRIFVADYAEEELLRGFLLAGFTSFTLISVWSLYRDRWFFRAGVALSCLNIASFILAIVFQNKYLESLVFCIAILFSMLSCVIAGRRVFSLQETDNNTLMGAICVYLLLGLIFAMIYTVISYIFPADAFRGLDTIENSFQFENLLYFSFVTLTTAGYGDITPVNPIIRTFAYFEMIAGQFYMAILVSGLVAHFMGTKMRK